jgi:hypothetical protein
MWSREYKPNPELEQAKKFEREALESVHWYTPWIIVAD